MTPEVGTVQLDPYDYYSALTSGTTAERLFHRARARLICAAVEPDGERILEVGSGAGAIAIPLAQAGGVVTALELGREHLATLATHAETAGVRVEGVLGEAARLPFEEDSFDVVVIASLVHLVERPGPILREAERVCRPDGRIVVAGPWRFHPKSMTWVKTLLRGAPPETKTHPFTVERLRRLLIRSRLVGTRTDRAMGYVVTTWTPDRKPADTSGPR